MSSPIAPPESPHDAITIMHALVDPRISPQLQEEFGDTLDTTIDNVSAWRVQAIEASYRGLSARVNKVGEERTQALGGSPADGPPTLPGTLAAVLQEPEPFGGLEPHPFTSVESDVVYSALRKAAWHKGLRRSANELLARVAPHAPERIARRVGVAAAVATVSLLHHR